MSPQQIEYTIQSIAPGAQYTYDVDELRLQIQLESHHPSRSEVERYLANHLPVTLLVVVLDPADYETDEEYAERVRLAENARLTRERMFALMRVNSVDLEARDAVRWQGERSGHMETIVSLSRNDDTAIDLLRVLRDLAEQGGLEIELAIVARVPVVGPQRGAPGQVRAPVAAGQTVGAGQAVYMHDDGTVSGQPRRP